VTYTAKNHRTPEMTKEHCLQGQFTTSELGAKAETVSYHKANRGCLLEHGASSFALLLNIYRNGYVKNLNLLISAAALFAASAVTYAQDENGISTELEFGAIATSGNTEDESINFKGQVGWIDDAWEYNFRVNAFRSSRQSQLAAQRVYSVASAAYDLSEISFVETRLAHEDDRFSGYDSQTDLTVNYGRSLLNDRENMSLDTTVGIGYRQSLAPENDFDEAIFRLAGDYNWNISDSAIFHQLLAAEAGGETSIFRSESSIETKILENLSLKFSVDIKHQTEVPVGREKTDTATAVTLVMRF
jgi:putative salt-induced outer membrane protein